MLGIYSKHSQRKQRRRHSSGSMRRRMMAERLENRLVLSATIGNNLSVGSELQNYRLAISATAEYTSFFGGQAAALAAIESTVDDINEIFEEELAISFQLVSGTDTIFTDSSTDGFDESDIFQMLSVNTGILDGVLGANSYDIGHVFGTFPVGGSGLAGLGVIGRPNKGAGASTSANPQGASWVKLVAHEFGHQFGAAHTFNADAFGSAVGSRSANNAYEPASGSTLMSYAGISADAGGDDNLQSRTDGYFHAASFESIQSHIASTAPPNSFTATGNTPPTIVAGSDFTIPAGTPFELTATGTDADVGDSLTYTWEQLDLGPSMSLPISDNGSSPLFRSFSPTTQSNRVFPQLSDLVSGTDTASIGEALPTTTRPLNFRATVRDGNNGVNSDDVLISVVDTGTPFAVTSPNTAVNWTGGSTQTITWDVAGTNANGIDAANVAIDLSLDGGLTYPLELTASTANDGSFQLTVPNIDAADARLRIRGVGNVFFDISDADFAITRNPNAAGVTIVETGGTTVVNEDGVIGGNDIDQYSIALNTTPTSSLDLTIDADAQTEISTDGVTFVSSVTLAMANTAPQTIFVRGFDDTIEEGIHAGTITHSITASSDPAYSTATLINPVSVQIADDELQPLVGVDFEKPDTIDISPTNWTTITNRFSRTDSNLIDELGFATSIDLSVSIGGGATTSDSDAPANLPDHSPSLAGLDGSRFAGTSITLTWSDLTPGTDYNVWLFATRQFSNQGDHTVTTAGANNPAPFVMGVEAAGFGALMVNGNVADPARNLQADAITVTADANGEIVISVTNTGGKDLIGLNGAAIQEIGVEMVEYDFGDAPTAALAAQQTGEASFASDYPVSLADNGARHILVGPTLGPQRDSEADGIASALADGDDITGVNDEDGVIFGDIVAGANAGINIEVQNADDARVDAWIDFNKDGAWDPSEKILDGVAVNSGLQTLNYTVPSGAGSGVTFARVRVSTAGGLLPTGEAMDGEVEDYAVTIASISSASVNDGAGTRSEISSIEVVFDSDVNATASDFVLINTDNDQRINGITVSNNGSGVSTLTFEPGPGVISGENSEVPPTLDNGNYELRFRPTVQDGSDEPIVIDQFFRKYGEADATSESVGLTDFAVFRGAFGGEVGDGNYRSDLDANRDGIIGLTDFAAFRSGFGT